MSIAIKIENLSKQYRLGQVGTGTISHDINRWWYQVRGKGNPYLKIGESNDRTLKGNSEYVWALRDINFEVQQGEILGIIGKNGAGKSTLLKILSKVTGPTTGSIKTKGRIASLLEVGTGFHPEMTGRENIYMNGTIMGMNKHEISNKLDEIVTFAGIERYLDTPVKRYSSGMTVRLGFSIAAHLEPEILVVDEVLAVGDAEFQKKAIGKMHDVSKGEGRTVLFVSHNMASVKALCTRGIVLENGKVSFDGDITDAVNKYLMIGGIGEDSKGNVIWKEGMEPGGEETKLKSIRLLNESGENSQTFLTSNPITVEIKYEVMKEIIGSRVVMKLIDSNNIIILSSTNHNSDLVRKKPGIYTSVCSIPPNLLNKGRHNVFIQIGIPGEKVLVAGKSFLYFDTILTDNNGSTFPEDWPGMVAPKLEWKTNLL